MKRAILTLCALLVAGAAHARALVILPPTQANSANFGTGANVLEKVVLGTLATTGADYDVVRGSTLQSKASFNAPVSAYLRHGVWWPNGMGAVTSAGDSIKRTYDLVIHVGVVQGAVYSGYRPDSLTLVAYYPTVTQLFIGNHNVSGNGPFTPSTSCSTGVVGNQKGYAAHMDSTLNAYAVGDAGKTWKTTVQFIAQGSAGSRWSRGFRPIIGSVSTRIDGVLNNNFDYPDPLCTTCAYSSDPDSVALWEVTNRVAGGLPIGGNAKSSIFTCLAAGFRIYTPDMGLLMAALARADSASGGGLWGSDAKLPVRTWFHIDDGWKRSASDVGQVGGIPWADTTTLIASIDSLASLRVPFVVGVDLDSLADKSGYDDRWWRRAAPYVRYTPHNHAGVDGGPTRAQNIPNGSQNAGNQFMRPFDVWGKQRTRVLWGSVDSLLAYGIGDYVRDVADTGSVYWLNKRAWWLADSAFGRSNVDRFVMPPGDDWTNKSMTRLSSDSLDAVLAVGYLTGARGFRQNVGSSGGSYLHRGGSSEFGYDPQTRGYTVRDRRAPAWVPATVFGNKCGIQGISHYYDTGSVSSWSRCEAVGQARADVHMVGLLASGYGGLALSGGTYSASETQRTIGWACHVGDFITPSGYTNAGNGVVNRPAFYHFKYFVNKMRVVNALAGREVLKVVYPDEVQP